MKIKHLLLTFLAAALMPRVAMAQTPNLYTSYTATAGVTDYTPQGYPYLVDNNNNTKWCVGNFSGPNNLGLYIEFYSAEPIIPSGYVLTTADDNATWHGRNPKDWTIKAKANPNDEWTTIATVTNDQVLQDVNLTDFAFSVDNPNQTAYQYFRFDVTAIQSGGCFQLAELRFVVVDEQPNAQAQTTETIGTGTSTTTYVFPGEYDYQYSVFLYRPNDVAVCLNNDFDLSSIAYDVVDYYSATIDELTFWVKDVDESDYENQAYLWYTNTFSHYIEGATEVYSTQTPFNLTEGWNTFNFTTDFSHQAGKALLVAVRGVCNNSNSSYNPKCHCHYTNYSTDGYSVWYKGSMSTTDPGLDIQGESVSTDRANIQLGVTYSSAFPSDLTVTYPTCDATEVTLGWTENGEATAWQICLNDDETNLIAATTNPFTLTNLTPETLYTAKVRSNYGDTQSSWSSPVSFIPTFKTIIGTGGEFITVLPSDPSKKYSLTQQIYTPAELGTAADIASIDFYNQGDLETTRNLQIYMTHTDQNEFSNWLNDDWIGVASGDLVFSGTVNFVKDAWTSIVLDTPFSYNGTQNVVITVDDNTGTAPNMSFYGDYLFLCYGSQSYQTKFYAGYDNYDPTNNPGSSTYALNQKNHIRVMKMQPPTGLTVSDVTGSSATLSWAGEQNQYEVRYRVSGTEPGEWVSQSVVGNLITINGLHDDTDYEWQVRGLLTENGGGGTTWCTGSFHTIVACTAPDNLQTTNLRYDAATLNWDGIQNDYSLRYRSAADVVSDDFERSTVYGNYWSTGQEGGAPAWEIGSGDASPTTGAHSGSLNAYVHFSTNESYYSWAASDLSAWIPVNPDWTYYISFWFINSANSAGYYDTFSIEYTTQGVSEYTTIWRSQGHYDTWQHVVIDLSSLPLNNWAILRIKAKPDLIYYHYGNGIGIDDFVVHGQGEWMQLDHVTSPFNLIDLPQNHSYEWQIQGLSVDCPDGQGDWSEIASFTLPDDGCNIPENLSISNLQCNAATLGWTGVQYNYNVRYRIACEEETFFEDFSGYTAMSYSGGTPVAGINLPSDWIFQSQPGPWPPRISNVDLGWCPAGMASQGNFLRMSSYSTYAVMPYIANLSSFSFKYAFDCDEMNDIFQVGYVTDISNIGSTFIAFTDVAINATTTLTTITLTEDDINILRNTNDARLTFYWNPISTHVVGIDDITYTIAADVWNTSNANVTSPIVINGLENNTTYEWQVQGINAACNGGGTEWSEPAFFHTLQGSTFVKHIAPYTENGGYYLIASPIAGTTNPTRVTNLLSNSYDLYRFNQGANLQWENWKSHANNDEHYHFNLESGSGYLYANSGNVTLVFSGTPYSGNGQVTLSKTEGASLGEWNLIGNPLSTAATLGSKPFYIMNEYGTEIIAADNDHRVIAPMQGVFVQAESDGEIVTFTAQVRDGENDNEGLVLNLSQGNSAPIDRVIVRFGEGEALPKLQIRNNSAKVYIPQDGKDYAIVSSNGHSELPVNFIAAENGTYTLTVSESLNSKFLILNYLHLIDNLTGADIDLLQMPTYTFEAKTDDNPSRFRLVFQAL
jgi:hypothetical protein